jgi:monoterpene epsilon-lactone hydrolase
MRKYFLAWTVSLLALTSSAEPKGTWEIGVRALPPPAGASDALRAVIAASPQPDVAGARSRAPQSAEQWQAILTARRTARPLEELGQMTGTRIERQVIDGVRVHRVQPEQVADAFAGCLFLYVHGGAYVFGGGDSAPSEGAIIAGRSGIPALSVDYRMPPSDPFPAAVDDVVTVYRHVLDSVAPGCVAIGGTSAGGGLSLAVVHRLKALGLPLPGAVYAGTPWADLTDTGDSIHANEGVDRNLITYDGVLKAAALLYADGHDLRDPLLSPVYGDFQGFPPTYLVTGTRDLFLSDTARTHRKLRAAGVDAQLNVYEGMSHAEYAMVTNAPEHEQVYDELTEFLAAHLRR